MNTFQSGKNITACAVYLQRAHVLQAAALCKVPQQEGRHVQPAAATSIPYELQQFAQACLASMLALGAAHCSPTSDYLDRQLHA